MTDRELLERFGDVLTGKEREVLELYVRGMSQRAIALALDLSRSAVQSRIETASRRLRLARKEAEREAEPVAE